jgi:hypothetical protein
VEPAAVSVTVAVKVTGWPNTDGLEDETATVLVLAMVTVWPPASEPPLFVKLPSALT